MVNIMIPSHMSETHAFLGLISSAVVLSLFQKASKVLREAVEVKLTTLKQA